MFYEFAGKLREISPEEIDPGRLTVGYISCAGMDAVCERFGFSLSTADACRETGIHFRSGVEVYDDYTFTVLRIAEPGGDDDRDDFIALYFARNMVIVVDIRDTDGSTKKLLSSVLTRYAEREVTLEKLTYSFFEQLLNKDIKFLEETGGDITRREEEIVGGTADDDFNSMLLGKKKVLLRMHNYYEQILDISETLEENDNDIFGADDPIYMANLSKKTVRMREDVDSLNSALVHLQDAYSSYLDSKLNHLMKIFTVITTVFYPLTIIVGWYGMNFQGMPEFAWKYGYVYVIVLSLIVVSALIIFGKKKKWF